jgi:hypothetical protein
MLFEALKEKNAELILKYADEIKIQLFGGGNNNNEMTEEEAERYQEDAGKRLDEFLEISRRRLQVNGIADGDTNGNLYNEFVKCICRKL